MNHIAVDWFWGAIGFAAGLAVRSLWPPSVGVQIARYSVAQTGIANAGNETSTENQEEVPALPIR
jgi:hypothetical protein